MQRRRLIGAVVVAALALVLFGFPGAFEAAFFPWGTLIIALFLVLIGYLVWPAFEVTSQIAYPRGFTLAPNPARVLFAVASSAAMTLVWLLVSLLLPFDPTVAGIIRGFVIVALLMYIARPGGLRQPGRQA